MRAGCQNGAGEGGKERRDGEFAAQGNDDSLSWEDMALGHKQLQTVKQSWRALRSCLRLRPAHLWAPHRIHAEVTITVPALLRDRAPGDGRSNTWVDPKRIQLALLSGEIGKSGN